MAQTFDVAKYKAPFLEITRKKYADQAIWFLNAFWKDVEKDAENVWKCTQKFIELDEKKKKEGNELDEFQSHKFLESLGETLTVIALREKLRKIDLDANGQMALMEYLIFRYDKRVPDVVESPQGDNTEEINQAQENLRAVQAALEEVQHRLEEQKTAYEAQKKAEAETKAAEEAVKKAEAELKAAIDDLKNQENAYNKKIAELEAKSKDSSVGMVSKNKAAAELAQLKQEDPLPLRKAKLTQEAALRKVEKQRKEAEAATQRQLEKSKALEESVRQVEAAMAETEARFQEAQDYLEEVKRKGGVAHGAIWFMERELKEAQKYLPKRKQNL